ncbi:MAG: hypothetical protein ACYDH8_13995 [Syntrophales bacterium]
MFENFRDTLIFIEWVTFFAVLIVLAIQFFNLYRISRVKDAVLHDNWNWTEVVRSIFHWLVPFGSQGMKDHPFVTLGYFFFHLSFLFTLIFLSSHVFTDTGWLGGGSLIADLTALVFMVSVVFIVIRRLIAPEVRIVTTLSDYLLLALVTALFITGYYMGFHPGTELGINYENILIIHILLSELLIILIPFTKLGHMILFFFTRAIIGVEFGARRGVKSW